MNRPSVRFKIASLCSSVLLVALLLLGALDWAQLLKPEPPMFGGSKTKRVNFGWALPKAETITPAPPDDVDAWSYEFLFGRPSPD
jgi:hypothetical protein